MKNIYFILLSCLIFSQTSKSQITGITPNQSQVGQNVLSAIVTSNGLFMMMATPSGNLNQIYLYQGSTQIVLFSNPTFNGPVVTHPDTAKNINFNIPVNAPTGLYNLVVKTQNTSGIGFRTDTLISAFTVQPADGYLQGNIYEDINFNQQRDLNEPGIYGHPISIQPGSYYYNTDSSGNFSVPVPNGTHVVQCGGNGTYGFLYPSTDSTSFTVTMNNANITGLDFGMFRGLTGLAPSQSIAGRTINFTVTSRHLFGNISYLSFTNANNSFIFYSNGLIQTVDSNTATFNVVIPSNATPGLYHLRIRISGQSYNHYLLNCLTILPYESFLQGKIYFDINGNGLLDIQEPGLPNERVNNFPDSSAGFSDHLGNYSIGVLNGNHTVAWTPSSTSIFQLSSDSASYTLNNSATVTGLDFGLTTTNPDYSCDVKLTGSFPRCNSNVAYYITYTNTSNIPFNGILYLTKDPSTTYSNASMTPSGFNGDTIFWNFSNLQPFTPNILNVWLTLPASGIIQTTAGIISLDGSGLQQLSDVATIYETVRCAYDPNDKSVSPEGFGPDHLTLIGDWLEYLVRFQNTGTDTAFNVTIYDDLSGDLELNTFEMLGSSHSVTTEVKQNGQAIFTFANILLPDSNVDEPGSHGFLKYKIKSKNSTLEQSLVENTAFIVFDANAPIVTNTTENLMVSFIPVGLQEIVKSSGQAIIYPNPFSSTALLIFNNPAHTRVQIEIRDAIGNLLHADKTNGEEYLIQKQNLRAGIYFYRLIYEDSKLNLKGKFIIK